MLDRAIMTCLIAVLAGCASLSSPSAAQPTAPISIAFRNTAAIPSTATDQNAVAFTITGLSGITFLGSDPATGVARFAAVMDNSNKVVIIRVTFTSAGSISGVQVERGLSLSLTRDFEGISVTARGTLLVAEEDTPAIHEFSIANGSLVRTITPPTIFTQRRGNYGFESLTSAAPLGGPSAGAFAWTANEEALTPDGPLSSQSQGTVVRLVRVPATPTFAAMSPVSTWPQFAYRTQAWHGSSITGARSGVSELVLLPDATLLALERSFAFNLAGFFQCRIYEVNFAGATDVRSFTSGLAGQTFTPVSKRLLWSGSNVNNMEGLALGPCLDRVRGGGGASDSYVLLGIVDDADPISMNTLAAFVVSGVRSQAPAQDTPLP